MGYRTGPQGFNAPREDGQGSPGSCEHDWTVWNRDLPDGKQQRQCMDCGEKIVVDSKRQ